MDIETKHYIKFKYDDNTSYYLGGEIPDGSIDAIIKEYGTDEVEVKKKMSGFRDSFSLLAFGLYDINFLTHEGLTYQTNALNSYWVYFGERAELDDYSMTMREIVGNYNNSSSFCKVGNRFYPMGPDDMTFDEFVNKYYQSFERLNLKILR